MKTYKRKARREPPPDNRAAYIIKMNTKNAAILKGIAAFFYSTDFLCIDFYFHVYQRRSTYLYGRLCRFVCFFI